MGIFGSEVKILGTWVIDMVFKLYTQETIINSTVND